MKRVVVTVLAFRSSATIEAAVRSALDQDHDGPVDVLVREQGGDATELALLQTITTDRPERSVTVESGPNLGFAGGHDRLLASEVARAADVVVLLNSDATLDASFLRQALPAFDDPTVGAVQGKVLRPDSRTIDAAGLVVLRTRRAEARCQGEPDDGRADRPGDVFGVDGAVAVYRRAALDDVALDSHVLASELGSYFEDVELAWRLQWRGWKTRYVPDALAVHLRSGREDGGVSRLARVRRRGAMDAAARQRAFANSRLVTVRVEPLGRLLRDALPIAVRELGGWLSLLAVHPRDIPACVGHIARGLPAAVRARRSILRHRRPGTYPHDWIDRPFSAR